jgi:5-methylcytosine-specific restriction endonuclease McrA
LKKRPDPFYYSAAWRKTKALVLARDGYRCVVCGADVSAPGASRVDHIIARKDRPDFALDPANLRTLCATHDNQAHREKGSRSAVRAERFGGCDVTGMPLDKGHPWNRRE